jgi:putative nucleotide binding protein
MQMPAKDDYAIVLDFLSGGRPSDRKAEPISQAIGEKFLNLLELAIKDGVALKSGDRVYIGADKRDQVQYIRSRIEYRELTNFAKAEIEDILAKLIGGDEARFINFFNKAGPVTTRMHSLELLPGVGKKHMWEIIKARRDKPFESFEDLRKRVTMLPDPKKIVVKRIIEELEDKDGHRLFVSGGNMGIPQ